MEGFIYEQIKSKQNLNEGIEPYYFVELDLEINVLTYMWHGQ